MGIRNGQQYLASLRDGRQMWIDGELRQRRRHGSPLCGGRAYDGRALRHAARAVAPREDDLCVAVERRARRPFLHRAALDRGSRAPARDGEDLDGRDLRHVRPQPRFHEHHPHRLRLGDRRVRREGPEIQRQYLELLSVLPRERRRDDAYADQPAGRSLEARREAGQGPRRQDRQGDGCRHRGHRRPHGLDLVRLFARPPGHALDLSCEQRGGAPLCVRLRGAGATPRGCASSAGRRSCIRTPARRWTIRSRRGSTRRMRW